MRPVIPHAGTDTKWRCAVMNGAGGGRAQQDLAEMFELEMDLELNQYETGNNVSPRAQQAEEENAIESRARAHQQS